MVDTAVIPAHAATTAGGDVPGGGTTPGSGPTPPPTTPCPDYSFRDKELTLKMTAGSAATDSDSEGLLAKMKSTLVPDASAAPVITGDLCIQTSECGKYFTAKLLYVYEGEMFHETAGQGMVGGPAVDFPLTAAQFPVCNGLGSGSIKVYSVGDSGAEFAFDVGYFSATSPPLLPVGTGCPTTGYGPPDCEAV